MIFYYFDSLLIHFSFMGILSILLISISLSMDSFAVAIANGVTQCKVSISKTFQIALSFAVFQALLPFLGWLAGQSVENLIKDIDHWVAFILLLIIGVKMIYEGIRHSEAAEVKELKLNIIIVQSIATSIDAFVIGISLAFLKEAILIPIITIGVTTFLFSFLGVQLGKMIGNKIGKSVGVFGGIVLIGIGTKIIIEHMFL